MSTTEASTSKNYLFAVFTILLGAVGLFASFELLTEFIKTLQAEDYIPNCDVSVLVTCGPNMDSPQGSLFGFSNTILGLGAFVAPIAVGVAILAGAKFASWFWWLYRAGLLGGLALVFWLSYQSIFVLGTLCPWCMVVWTVMIPLFFFSVFKPEAAGLVKTSPGVARVFNALNSWAWVFVFASYLLIASVAQFKLDWFAEFSR